MIKYFAGNNRTKLLECSKKIILNNKFPIVNYIIEDNSKYTVNHEYNKLFKQINSDHVIALKLSSFEFDINLVKDITNKYITKNIPIIIDAEENKNYQKYRDITNSLMYTYNKSSINIIKTYQMYRRDSLDELNDDLKFMKKKNAFLAPKLVRGAYFYKEKDGGHLFEKKEDTDDNFDNAILKCYNEKNLFNIVATHNQNSIFFASRLNREKIFAFAHLLGMNETVMDKIKKNHRVYTYLPYGPYSKMIPYLTRRLYENIDTLKYMFK